MTLRDVEAGDLPVFFEHQRDPKSTRMAAFPARNWQEFQDHWRVRVLGNPTVLVKTVLAGNAVAGNIESWTEAHQRILGYWIGRPYWNQGVATAALVEFLRHEQHRPLFAFVATHNVASRRVLEKCGFRSDGPPLPAADGILELHFRLGAIDCA